MELSTRAVRATAIALLLVAVPTHAKIHLSFGLYTSNKPTSMVKQFRPVLDLMETELSTLLEEEVDIRMQVAKDYSQGIEHLASGKVDFSRFGPASYIEAKKANSGLRILAMERVGGDKVFYGVIAVAKDNSIDSVNELRGKSFAFGNDQSTIGRYLSQQFLRNNGIYSADLSRFDYLGRHDTVGTAVGAHHFEAGALNESTFTKLVAKGVGIRELARFPNVTKPWIAREGLPPRLFEAVRQALLNLSDPVLQKTLKVDGFVSGDDGDFEDIRTAIEKNDLFFKPSPTVAVTDMQQTSSPGAETASPTPAAALEAAPVTGPAAADANANANANADNVILESPDAAASGQGVLEDSAASATAAMAAGENAEIESATPAADSTPRASTSPARPAQADETHQVAGENAASEPERADDEPSRVTPAKRSIATTPVIVDTEGMSTHSTQSALAGEPTADVNTPTAPDSTTMVPNATLDAAQPAELIENDQSRKNASTKTLIPTADSNATPDPDHPALPDTQSSRMLPAPQSGAVSFELPAPQVRDVHMDNADFTIAGPVNPNPAALPIQ